MSEQGPNGVGTGARFQYDEAVIYKSIFKHRIRTTAFRRCGSPLFT